MKVSYLNENVILEVIEEWGHDIEQGKIRNPFYDEDDYIEGEPYDPFLIREGLVQKGIQGIKSFFGNGDSISPYNPINKGDGIVYRLDRRAKASSNNYTMKGEYDNYMNLLQQLSQIIDEKNIPLNTTLAQFIGGKYNSGKFGRLSGRQFNRKSQGSKSQRRIYKEN